MTEAEWLGCTDPQKMLNYLEGKTSERKLRLFACACCRRIWPAIKEPFEKEAVELAERYADGLCASEDLESAQTSGWPDEDRRNTQTMEAAAFAVQLTLARPLTVEAAPAWEYAAWARGEPLAAEEAAQADLLRCLLGDPFRPLALDLAWLAWNSGTIPKLAQAMYDERAFGHLPILADALEEAGCEDADLLGHLRGPGPHVRGCWAVDLLLGKG
jgi:hypothetical protein